MTDGIKREEVHGLAFCGDEFAARNVILEIENGIITKIEDTNKAPKEWICPAFFNAHTHIADTVALDIPQEGRTLSELVAPPNGLKHQILQSTAPEKLELAMRETMEFMKLGGTAGFADFREGGMNGVKLLWDARVLGITPLILGREGGEEISDGLGLSSAKSFEQDYELVQKMRKLGKLVAVHAGEAGSHDVDAAFSLCPDFIIHATHFTNEHIRRAADENIPLVICPRSNWVLGGTNTSERPPVRKMLDAGCTLLLGTDNVMFVSPDMFAECGFLKTVYKTSAAETLRMATGGFSFLKTSSVIKEGNPANFFTVDPGFAANWTKSPLDTLILRLQRRDIRRTFFTLENLS